MPLLRGRVTSFLTLVLTIKGDVMDAIELYKSIQDDIEYIQRIERQIQMNLFDGNLELDFDNDAIDGYYIQEGNLCIEY